MHRPPATEGEPDRRQWLRLVEHHYWAKLSDPQWRPESEKRLVDQWSSIAPHERLDGMGSAPPSCSDFEPAIMFLQLGASLGEDGVPTGLLLALSSAPRRRLGGVRLATVLTR